MLASANSFHFIRLAAALAVLYSHSFVLAGLPEPLPMAGQTFGSFAVAVFFATSGFLVCQSWCRDPAPSRFAMRRALRILPGLAVAAALVCFVAGPLLSSLSAKDYFASSDTWTYLPRALLFLPTSTLPGVFADNPYPHANNGSLWTIRYEVLCYLLLAAAGWLTLRRSLQSACLALTLALATLWFALTITGSAPYLLPVLWRFGTELYADRIANLGVLFFVGCLFALCFDREQLVRRLSLPTAGVLIALCAIVPDARVVTVLLWFAIPYAAISFAYKAPRLLHAFARVDYSYGIYIYAFPVQQAVAQLLNQPKEQWLISLLTTLIITTVLAALSWHWIEQPALRLKPSRRASEK